jgi:dTDP-4-amino-4,6-dideoxygalactose transaminase
MAEISIPICSLADQNEALRERIDVAVRGVLSSGVFLNGPWTRQFSREFAEWCGVKHCIPVANGTDALELAMRALKIGPRDEVITAANAGGYATGVCHQLGATPVWIDVQPETLGLDPNRIEAAITDRTRLVVVTHLYGILADVAAIRDAMDRLGRADIRILEDCAQAHGASIKGCKAGSFGDIATFSFYPTKNLGAFGDAGAVVTNIAELSERVDRLRQYGWVEKYHSEISLGRNSRIDELQAAILCIKLPHVDGWNTRRRQIFDNYVTEIKAPNSIVGAMHQANVAHMVIMRTPHRDAVRQALAKAGIASDIHYPVLDCDQTSQRGLPGRKLPLPISERAKDEILTLPCYPELTNSQVGTVIAAVNATTSNSTAMGQRQ